MNNKEHARLANEEAARKEAATRAESGQTFKSVINTDVDRTNIGEEAHRVGAANRTAREEAAREAAHGNPVGRALTEDQRVSTTVNPVISANDPQNPRYTDASDFYDSRDPEDPRDLRFINASDGRDPRYTDNKNPRDPRHNDGFDPKTQRESNQWAGAEFRLVDTNADGVPDSIQIVPISDKRNKLEADRIKYSPYHVMLTAAKDGASKANRGKSAVEIAAAVTVAAERADKAWKGDKPPVTPVTLENKAAVAEAIEVKTAIEAELRKPKV